DLLILHVPQEHRELITAEPGHGIPGTKRRGDPSPDGHQQLVAHLVAERVVDRLEIIQVEEENGNPAFRVRAQCVIEVDPESGPIGKVGKRVMERLVGQLLLEGLTLAHVSHVQDKASHGWQLEQVGDRQDRKSTRLNSSHLGISYAVFCLKKKKK